MSDTITMTPQELQDRIKDAVQCSLDARELPDDDLINELEINIDRLRGDTELNAGCCSCIAAEIQEIVRRYRELRT